MAQELKTSTRASRKSANVKKHRSPLPEIFVPELRQAALPLISSRGFEAHQRRSPQSDVRAFSARAARSTERFVELPVAAQSARMLRDGHSGFGQVRSPTSSALPRLASEPSWHSVNPVEPPSLTEKRLFQAARVLHRGSDPRDWCEKFAHLEEIAEVTVLPSISLTALIFNFLLEIADALPAHKSLIKGLVSFLEVATYPEFCEKDSRYGVNALKFDKKQSLGSLNAFTFQRRGTGVGVEGQALASKFSSGGQHGLTGAGVEGSAMSPQFSAVAQAVTPKFSIGSPTMLHKSSLGESLSPSMHSAPPLPSFPVMESSEEDEDSEEEEDDEEEEQLEELDTAELVGADAVERDSIRASLKLLASAKTSVEAMPFLKTRDSSVADESSNMHTRLSMPDEQWLLKLDNLPTRTRGRADNGRRRMICGNVAAPEQTIPERYKDYKPHFAITRKQRWQLSRVKNTLEWVNEICTNIEGRQRAQHWLLDMLHEMTHGSITTWCFAFWKISSTEVAMFTKQCAKLKSPNQVQKRRVLYHWKLVATMLGLNRILQEVADRKNELDSMQVEESNFEITAKELAVDLDMSEGNCARSKVTLKKLEAVRLELQERLELMQPEVLKRVLPQLLQAWMHSFVTVADASYLKCRSMMMTKDLTHLVLHDDETSSKVAMLPVEEILTRWVNYLLVEVKYCAADLLDSAIKDHVSDVRSAWSSKDTSTFSHRCRLVRAVHLVTNLGEDLKDGTVLTALCAMLKAQRAGQKAFDPADLAPLDERDSDLKAAAVLKYMHALAPTTKARCLLRRSDIQKGNHQVLSQFLAAVFLHEAPGLQRADSRDMRGRRSENNTVLTKHQVHYLHQLMNRGAASDDESEASSSEGEDNEPPMLRFFHTLQELGGPICYEHLQDPLRLLRKGEELADLHRLTVQELLLRWVNVQAADQGRGFIKDFHSDLRDGWILLAIIKKVAPEVVKVSGIVDAHLRSEAQSLEAVLECGPRCVDPFVLTEESIHAGREDMLLQFIGNLFLTRPSLRPQHGSSIFGDFSHLERTIQHGFEVHSAKDKPHGFKILRGFCAEMKDDHEALIKAMDSILENQQVMKELQLRVKVFLTESASKERGSASATAGMSSPRGRPDLARLSILRGNSHKSLEDITPKGLPSSISKKESRSNLLNKHPGSPHGQPLPTEPVDTYTERAQTIVRQHSRLFQDMYNFYSITLGSRAEPRLPLGGIMRIYHVCKLRCPCVFVSPMMAEKAYWEVLEKDLPPWRQSSIEGATGTQFVLEGLSVRGFIRWVVRIAMHRSEALSKKGEGIDFPTCFQTLVEQHLKPHSCQLPEDEFSRISQEHDVRAVLMSREQFLWPIFEFYSSKVEKGNMDSRFAILEEEDENYEDEGLGEVMEVDALIAALQDAKLLNGRVTKDVVESVCMNIFAQAGSGNNERISCAACQEKVAITASQAWEKCRTLTKWVKLDVRETRQSTARSIVRAFAVKSKSIKRWSETQGRASLVQGRATLDGDTTTSRRVSTVMSVAGLKRPSRWDAKSNPVADKASLVEAKEKDAGMSYFDFLDALLALSVYSNPSPFVAIKMRAERFVHGCFVPGIIAYCREIVEQGPPDCGNRDEMEAYFRHQDLLERLTAENAATEVLKARRVLRQAVVHRKTKLERPRSSDDNRRSLARRKSLLPESAWKDGRKSQRGLRGSWTAESVFP